MLLLKSTRECPPQGFEFIDPLTGWTSSNAERWSFAVLCKRVQFIRMEKRVKPDDLPTIEKEVSHQNAIRVSKIPGAQDYIRDDLSRKNGGKIKSVAYL